VIQEARRASGSRTSLRPEKLRTTPLYFEAMAPAPRVHVALLWLSEGDLMKFCRELEARPGTGATPWWPPASPERIGGNSTSYGPMFDW